MPLSSWPISRTRSRFGSVSCGFLTVVVSSLALLVSASGSAQTTVRPRFLIAFDTSGSMTVDLQGIPTYGDGITGSTRGLDTDCNGQRDDSRIYVAKEALRNMLYGFGDLEYALARFPMYGASDALCTTGPTSGPTINSNECNVASGPFVGSLGDPTLNTGAVLTSATSGAGACGSNWDGVAGRETPTSLIPSACRPSSPRLWAAGSPNVCLNYIGACPGTFFELGATDFTFPDGDVLVGFHGFGWPNVMDNRIGILKWIDNTESGFGTGRTSGDFCNHSGGGDCELRANGTTPLGGLLRASASYVTPIRAADTYGSCRPYRVLLLTDGVETCDGREAPIDAARQLFEDNNIPVYVVGVAIDAGGRSLLNEIAAAGGTDAGSAGGDNAFFADDPVTLAAGLADIVSDSLLIETCNGLDDDCDTAIDEGFVKFCDRPRGISSASSCDDPGETVCDGIDDNCNGVVDEGLLNRCGTCGATPTEICDGLDNDCDGMTDEGGVCSSCSRESEACDNADNDCDGRIDEDLSRACGVELGICTRGTEVCTTGDWSTCSGVTPGVELCDGLDNNCDGLIDNLTRPCGEDDGECVSGIQRCIGADTWGVCEGAAGPTDEICDGFDNDCDGRLDEEVPGIGDACGVSEGACEAGERQCIGGTAICVGETPPVTEVCDNVDNDCNGVVDDGLAVGAPCGSDVGECDPGIQYCVEGDLVCVGSADGVDELCDLLDNDCDGRIDEGLTGGPCGASEGLCEPGTQQCVRGREVCDGEVPAGSERCDCEDNDCDGSIDEEVKGGLCPGDSVCKDCQCAQPCNTDNEFLQCPTGRVPTEINGMCFCVAERCNPSECATQTLSNEGEVICAPDQSGVGVCVCKANECTSACAGVVCDEPLVCNPRDPRGVCVEDNCRGLGCDADHVCNVETGACEPDPCATATCATAEACRLGVCERSCASVECADAELCQSGSCVADPCDAVTCEASQVCSPDTGACVDNACLASVCGRGLVCDPATGACENDPCNYLHCPSGQVCSKGECALPIVVLPDAGVPLVERRIFASGGGGCGCRVSAPTEGKSPTLWLVFGILGTAIFARRRTRRLSVAVFAVASASVLGGCDVNPYCLNCSDARIVVRDGGTRPDARLPDGALPDSGPVLTDGGRDGCVVGADELCDGLDNDCDMAIDEGFDFTRDPNHCGNCDTACRPDHAFGVCVDSECGLGECDVEFLNLDGRDDNGCEYRCVPTAEDDSVCDLRDNDCDSRTDEDVNTATDTNNCGGCGRNCNLAHASERCVVGTCMIDTCEAGFVNVDGAQSNGCEYACVPAGVEACNTVDDDCDGNIDEGDPGGGAACGETRGECAGGNLHCINGDLICMGGVRPAAESCNTLDDDCDGAIDETTDFDSDPANCGACGAICAADNAVVRCTSEECVRLACDSGWVDLDSADLDCDYECQIRGVEACNGLDDDCDGRMDESLTTPVSFCNTTGVCSAGGSTPTCSGALGWTCDHPSPSYEAAETLCDGLDNDCDGDTDEPFAAKGDACSNGTGDCRQTGVLVCASDGLALVCNAAAAGTPATEECNGEDDDCDGNIDEAITPMAMGAVPVTGGSASTVWVMPYEASRPDATSTDAGRLSTAACSEANVLPWTTVTWEEADLACCALNDDGVCASSGVDGWALCDAADWQLACEGPTGSCDWSYSMTCGASEPTRCNGAEYDCVSGTAVDDDCLFSTGSPTFPGCYTDWAASGDIYDLSGNVKEWTSTEVADGLHSIRGGAYNNREGGRTCDFDFTVGDLDFAFPNTGFRCCYYDF